MKYKQKKRFTSFGNCQAHPIAQILMFDEQFNRHFEYVPFKKPAYMLTADDQNYVFDLVSSVDMFLHQNVGEAFGKMFSSDNLRGITKPNCQLISFPSIYFSGYTPEINYLRFIGGAINSFSDYHDINVLSYFVKNPVTCLQNSLAQYQADDYYSPDEVLDNAANTLLNLKEREQDCTIKVGGFIQQHWRDKRLFFSMNHPSNEVLNEVVKQVSEQLTLPKPEAYCGAEMLGDTHLPIYHSVQKLMNFEDQPSIKVRKNEMDLAEYFKRNINTYEGIPVSKLKHNLAHLKKAKMPLIEKYMSVI